MRFPFLGTTGVRVSELCMGTMTWGGEADKTESKAMYKLCRDRGINFFDCADVYNGGKSEEFLGDFMQSDRRDLVITSKFTYRTGSDMNQLGSSRRHLTYSVEDSLKRLKTDRIDIYFIHRFDPALPMEETLRALDDLVRQGKVLYLGVSNWAAWQIAKALGISREKSLEHFQCIQPMYNLVKRQAEVEILPMAISEKLGVISYSPLGAGLLTGKFRKNKRPVSGRIAEKDMYHKRYSQEGYYRIAEDFCRLAEAKGVHPATMALRWVMSHEGITAPIMGARNTEQLQIALDAVDETLSSQAREEISMLSPTPPPATDRLEEDLDPSLHLR